MILDCHVHYSMPIEPEYIIDLMKKTKTDYFNLVLVPDRERISSICEAMVLKDKSNGKCSVYSSLDVSNYFIHKKDLGKAFAKYTKSLMKMGVDGIKLIEGKPNMRKLLPIPDFDDMVWDPFFSYCENKQIPILWHVNDPEEFWDKAKIPSWAEIQGWYYDETFVNNEEQYRQIYKVLERHPNIKIIFAHVFFMSNQLDRLQKLLDTYKNVMIDLTPGIEMYINFSNNLVNAKKFFIKNQDRIIYGTDIGARAVIGNQPVNEKECFDRVEIVRSFLEKEKVEVKADGNFLIGFNDFTLNGLKLPKEILDKIYYDNFRIFTGNTKKINKRLVMKEAKRLKKTIFMMSLFDKHIKRNYIYLNNTIKYFKNKKEI